MPRKSIGSVIEVRMPEPLVEMVDRARGKESRSEWLRTAAALRLQSELPPGIVVPAGIVVDFENPDPVLKELTDAMAEPLTAEEMRPAPIIESPKVEPKGKPKWCQCGFKNDRRTYCKTCGALVKPSKGEA